MDSSLTLASRTAFEPYLTLLFAAAHCAQLYPFPSIYHRIPRDAAEAWGAGFAASAAPVDRSSLDVRGLVPVAGSPLASLSSSVRGGCWEAAVLCR